MKAGWPRKTLGEICGFVRGPFGGSLKKSVFVADGFAVYEQQHAIYDQFDDIRYFVNDAKFHEMQRFELRPNDLIMSCSGTMGKVAIVPENIRRGIINQALLKLTPTKTVSAEFLKYWMDSPDFQDSLKEQSGGAAIQNVASVSILKEIQISLPPLAEQQRIVGLLAEAFEGLATAKANAERNLQNARALFESHLQSVFTQRGPGWVEKRLEECFRLKSGDGLISSAMKDGKYPVFGGNGIAGMHDEFNLSGDNVIIGRVGALCGNARHITEEIWLTDNAFRIVDRCFEFDGAFLTYLLNFKNLRSLARQAAQPVISNSSLKDLLLPFPEIAKQKKIAVQLDALTEETQRLARLSERKHAALEALKKSLLHQAFTGEL